MGVDAAHPQTPMLGQGVNMAITDAYVCATRIALAIKQKKIDSIPNAISSFDTQYRRNQSKKIVLQARSYQNAFISSSKFLCWFIRFYVRFAPNSELTDKTDSFDKSNREFLKALDNEYQMSFCFVL